VKNCILKWPNGRIDRERNAAKASGFMKRQRGVHSTSLLRIIVKE
jgi:hypothetical protein